MKFKLLAILTVIAATSASAIDFHSYSFLAPEVSSSYQVTNAACALCFTNAPYGGITVTNAAAAPLGGFTNVASWGYYGNNPTGSNCYNLTWTNHNGIWVIPTNSTAATGVNGIRFVYNDKTPLCQDVPLWVDSMGRLPITVLTNGAYNQATQTPDNTTIGPATMNLRMFGAASAATAMNLIFVGVTDGTNEVTGANGQSGTWQWGVVPAAGVTIVSTNFPFWRFPGCKAVRLRSATLTTTAAANIGVTIQSLTLNGFIP